MFLYVFRAVAHVTITTAKKYVFEICDVKTWRFYKKPIGSLKSTFATQNIWKFTKFNKPFWLLKSPVADPEEGGGHPDSEIGGGVVSKKHFFRPFGHQFGQKIWGGGGAAPRDPPLVSVHVKESETVLVFGFHAVDSGSQILCQWSLHLHSTL